MTEPLPCKHVTVQDERAAYIDGGRWFDPVAERWRCPWCEDWAAAVLTAAAIRAVEDEGGDDPGDGGVKAFRDVFGRWPDEADGDPWSHVCAAVEGLTE